MLAILDVDYRDTESVGACLLARAWTDAAPCSQQVLHAPPAAAYRPGHFYERELPILQALLARVSEPLEAVIIDGYVWLGAEHQPGLGAHLSRALGGAVPVVGVAKTAYQGSGFAAPVRRGEGSRPLYVTAEGLAAERAAELVRQMHGPYRLPTLLRAVDQLCRA